MKSRVLFACAIAVVAFASCATSNPNAVSTIPWDERAAIDGMGQQYGMFEDSYAYDGMLAPEPFTYEQF